MFSSVRGLETYSTRFFVEWTDRAGAAHALLVTPEIYARLRGPYNRRNVYGAALAYGPVLPVELRDPVMRYALCGDAPLLRELGIDPEQIAGRVRIRYEPLPGTDLGDMPRHRGGALSMKNGWTGGQYSLFRAVFATYLCVHFLQLLPWGAELFSNQGVLPQATASPLIHLFPNVLAVWDSPGVVTALLALGRRAERAVRDRPARSGGRAGAVVYLGVPVRPRSAHRQSEHPIRRLAAGGACVPAAGALWLVGGAGGVDPGGGWRMPPAIFAAAWIVLALGYSYSGYTKLVSPSWRDGTALARVLDNPLARPGWLRETMLSLPAWLLHLGTWASLALELSFAPLALLRRLRPWLWAVILLMHLSLIAFIDFADLSLGMVMIHLFTFDPGWIRPLPASTEMLFYDGHCGLCQRSVRLILAEDAAGTAFRFAPLQGETFQSSIPAPERGALPLSLVVRTEKGALLTRSAGVLHILRRLGGVWRLLAGVLVLLPAAVRDRLYDGVARVRLHLFARPAEACPLMTPQLRARFDP